MDDYFFLFYYTVPLQIIATLSFILYGLRHYQKIEGYRSLVLYGAISFVQCVVSIYIGLFTEADLARTRFVRYSINIFMLLEWIIFYRFLIHSVSAFPARIILKVVFVAFIIIVLWHWLFTPAFGRTPARLTVLESLLVMAGCLLYYLQTFTSPPATRLLFHPPFWFITGMMLLFSFLLPLFLQLNIVIADFNNLYDALYIMNFIGYTILFLFFNIGLRCQIRMSI